jgi:high affinity sulfate transporter 1
VSAPTAQPSTGSQQAPAIVRRLGLLGGILPYSRGWLPADIVSGLTVAAVAIPVGLGYARIAGMPLQSGLYTVLLPVLLFAVFASSRRLVVGADSATAAISASAVGVLAANDPTNFIALSSALALMTGVCLLIAGRMSLGFLSDFLSRSVLAGFLTGVGIQIAIGQTHGMLGIDGTGNGTWEKFLTTIGNLPQTNVPDLVVSMAVVGTIMGLGAVWPRVPWPLVAVVGSMIASWALDLEGRFGVEMVGALPPGLPTPSLPIAPAGDILALLPTALVLLLVQIGQSVSTASAFALQHDDEYDANKDLYGLAAANFGSGLFSSFVVNSSPTQTGISDRAGTKSQVAMVVMALLTIPVLLFLTGVFAYLPEATMAAVVFVIAVSLMKFDVLNYLYRLPGHRGEFRVAISTAAFVAIFGVGGGIVWAIVASIAHNLTHTARPSNSVLTVDEDKKRHDNAVAAGLQTRPGLIVYRFAANLFYANAPRLVEDVRLLVSTSPNPLQYFVLDASEIHRADWTSAEALRKVIVSVQATGARFMIARLPDESRQVLDYYGITDLIGDDAYLDTVRHALRFVRKQRRA